MSKGLALALVVGVLASGCASSEPPKPSAAVYPAKGQTADQQGRDTSECQAWAKQNSGYDPTMETAKGAGIGLAVGAVVGAATGAAAGAATGAGAGRGAAAGAIIGGVGGGVGGGAYKYATSKDGYDKAFAACMQGKGYSVAR
jgi:hypothetical protein